MYTYINLYVSTVCTEKKTLSFTTKLYLCLHHGFTCTIRHKKLIYNQYELYRLEDSGETSITCSSIILDVCDLVTYTVLVPTNMYSFHHNVCATGTICWTIQACTMAPLIESVKACTELRACKLRSTTRVYCIAYSHVHVYSIPFQTGVP